MGYDGQYTSSDKGLVYLRARAYDPATVQFLSVDPIAALTRAQYNYTSDNPVNAVDPTGLLSWEDVSNASAGALDFLTFGASTKLAGDVFGFNSDCANFGTAGKIGAGLAFGVGLFDGATEAELGGNLLRRVGARLVDETGAVGRYGNLGNLAGRADEAVADVIRSHSGGASQVRQLQTGYGQLTLGQISELAARGDHEALRALKMVKEAGSQGKGGK